MNKKRCNLYYLHFPGLFPLSSVTFSILLVFSKAKLCNISKTIKKQTATTKFSYDVGKSIDKEESYIIDVTQLILILKTYKQLVSLGH